MITIKIKTDNQAFEPDCVAEVIRIIDHLIVQLEALGTLTDNEHLVLHDANGNTVGSFDTNQEDE